MLSLCLQFVCWASFQIWMGEGFCKLFARSQRRVRHRNNYYGQQSLGSLFSFERIKAAYTRPRSLSQQFSLIYISQFTHESFIRMSKSFDSIPTVFSTHARKRFALNGIIPSNWRLFFSSSASSVYFFFSFVISMVNTNFTTDFAEILQCFLNLYTETKWDCEKIAISYDNIDMRVIFAEYRYDKLINGHSRLATHFVVTKNSKNLTPMEFNSHSLKNKTINKKSTYQTFELVLFFIEEAIDRSNVYICYSGWFDRSIWVILIEYYFCTKHCCYYCSWW